MDLLTNSGCSRYVEFKAINKICMYQSGTIEQVYIQIQLQGPFHIIIYIERYHVHVQMYLKANWYPCWRKEK